MIRIAAFWMFNLKTTGLQFGYFFGLLFCVFFIIRGIREEKLSDILLGLIMFFMSMLIQDYTFGFAGINFLWEQLDGWPRHFPWLFPASVYFYFLALTNINFRFNKSHLVHIIPYILYLLFSLILFVNGLTPMNGLFKTTWGLIWDVFFNIISYGGLIFYFVKSLKIFKTYKIWTENQFSNTYDIELKWLRNFLVIFLIGNILHLINSVIDYLYDLPFEQDYYWQLFTVATIVYVGISGITQKQNHHMNFGSHDDQTDQVASEEGNHKNEDKTISSDEVFFKEKLEIFMDTKKPYLNPDLTLRDLAGSMNTNTGFLSSVINNSFKKNFNDYINEYRVKEFENAIKLKENQHLTLIALAYDSGFNSKATFNRAVKKFTGKMPSELTKDI